MHVRLYARRLYCIYVVFECRYYHRESTVEAFGLFVRQFKLSISKMRLKFIDHCNQMSGRKPAVSCLLRVNVVNIVVHMVLLTLLLFVDSVAIVVVVVVYYYPLLCLVLSSVHGGVSEDVHRDEWIVDNICYGGPRMLVVL